MRSAYKFINPEGVYFITSTIVEWIPVFTSEKYFKIITDNTKYSQKKRDLKCHAYVILDNHFHMVISGQELSKSIALLKSYSARKIIDELKKDGRSLILKQLESFKKQYKVKSEYQLWQEGSHPQEITNSDMLNQKIDYIHFNPVRRGLVEKPEDWKYSSASFYYAGNKSEIDIEILCWS
jgi:REP element-mobilizing transposase RayT